MGDSIPWLELDLNKRPTSSYYGFNVTRPPFDNVLVRQAFVMSINRRSIVELIENWFENVRQATTLTPSETLGRDLLNDVGLTFNPVRARELHAEAGYSDPSSFPQVFLIVSSRGEAYPGAYSRIADLVVQMWEENIGIAVEIEVHGDRATYRGLLDTGNFHMYQVAWGADVNDPDNFLNTVFYSSSQFNFGHFSPAEFDDLVIRASEEIDPVVRQLLCIEAERILTEELAGIIPLYHSCFYIGEYNIDYLSTGLSSVSHFSNQAPG